MNKLKIISFLFFVLSSISLFAQENNQVEMADQLYQSGKIYVVVGVLAIIFIGIVSYLVIIDRKLNKLEKEKKRLVL